MHGLLKSVSIIFGEESKFKLIIKSNVLVKWFSENYSNFFVVPRLQGGSGSVGIWGCFNFNGVGLCNIYAGQINQHTYIEMLENLDGRKWNKFSVLTSNLGLDA